MIQKELSKIRYYGKKNESKNLEFRSFLKCHDMDESEIDSIVHEINRKPCPFLSENICQIYDDSPEDCRSFPHLHKKGFLSRLLGVVYNCSVCPIVFNVYERLKARFKFSLANECAKLDPKTEQALSEEGMSRIVEGLGESIC